MNQASQLLSDRDRKLIESLVYDSSLKPRFNALGAHLSWADEMPSGITRDGIDTIADLWTARAFLYHGFDLPDLFDRSHFAKIWELATQEIPNWPGFNRLTLNDRDKKYYEEMLEKEDPFD